MATQSWTRAAPGGSIRAWKVDNAAALSTLQLTDDDVGRCAQAADTGVFYLLQAASPAIWVQLGNVVLPGGAGSPNDVWQPLSVMAVEDPMNHGAAGNGTTDDTTALANTIAALPAAGGIVYLRAGKVFKKTDRLVVTKAHCKIWAVNNGATIACVIGNTTDKQSLRSTATGFGVFGVLLTSDSTARGGSSDDHQLIADTTCSLVEWVGNRIVGSRAAGLFTFGAHDVYEHGNYVSFTWADHIHHTETAYNLWTWENWVNNNSMSLGDDVVAYVTYGDDDTGNVHDAECWRNVSIGTWWGRGIASIGCTRLNSHDNRMWNVAGAGLIVASEQGGSHATPSHDVSFTRDEVSLCGHAIGHAGVLISEDNPFATHGVAITNVALANVKSANNGGGGDFHTEGTITGLTNTGMDNTAAHLGAQPTTSDVVIRDTSVLMTLDTSHVASGQRPGLLRIHVRPVGALSAPTGFEERFEYVVKGSPTDVTNWASTRTAAGDYLSEQQIVAGTAYALLLCAAPVTLGTGVTGVTFADLRAGDLSGALSWLWNRVNTGSY